MSRILEGRTLYLYKNDGRKLPLTDGESDYHVSCAMPIITEGDVTGCVISAVKEDAPRMNFEVESKLVQTAAVFLSRQLES
jgi:AbrB family transcriptional regulator (stage V sporulation protein T)